MNKEEFFDLSKEYKIPQGSGIHEDVHY